MGFRLIVASALALTGVLAIAAPAFAGAPNYSCRFGTLRIVADVHRDVALVQSAPKQRVRLFDVPQYGSGGSGFTAARGDERYIVKLLAGGSGRLLKAATSRLSHQLADRTTIRRGICSAITGNHHAGWTTSSHLRTAPRADAPTIPETAGLPFVWTDPASTLASTSGWVAVRVWTHDGRRTDGFLPTTELRLPT